jgi:hypothetical protein
MVPAGRKTSHQGTMMIVRQRQSLGKENQILMINLRRSNLPRTGCCFGQSPEATGSAWIATMIEIDSY